MSINITTSVHAEKWDNFTAGNPNSNIFHTRQFLDIFKGSKKYTPFTFFLEEDGLPKAAVIAVQTRVVGPAFSSLTSRSVIYGGIICAPGVNERYWQRHIGKLISAYDTTMKNKVLYSEIRNVTEATPLILPLVREKYKFSPHLNYLLDLEQGEDVLWDNISQGLRKAIRKASQKSIEIVELNRDEQIAIFHELVSRTYSRVHIPSFEVEIFKNALKLLLPRGLIRITLARHQGSHIAARAALVYNGRVFDWFAGSNSEGDSLNANALLAWEMIAWGCANGAKWFDFGGAGNPNKPYGVREFKMRFMGQLVNFGRFTKIYSYPRYALSSLAYRTLRRFLY